MLRRGENREGDYTVKITRSRGLLLLLTRGYVLLRLTARPTPHRRRSAQLRLDRVCVLAFVTPWNAHVNASSLLPFQFRTPGIFSLMR
jgi:hypothetical protein